MPTLLRPTPLLPVIVGIVVALPFVSPSSSAHAQFDGWNVRPKVEIKTRFEPAEAAPGATVDMVLEITIEEGWHLYGAKNPEGGAPTLESIEGVDRGTGGLAVPDGTKFDYYGADAYWIEGKTEFRQKVVVPADAAVGERTVTGGLKQIACTKEYCDPPATIEFTGTLKVVAATEGNASSTNTLAAPPTDGLASPTDPWTVPSRIEIKPRFEPPKARPGETIDLVLEVEIDEGWHLYGAKEEYGLVPAIESLSHLERGDHKLQIPDGVRSEIAEDFYQWWIEGKTEFRQKVQVPADTAEGALEVTGGLAQMACTKEACDQPLTIPFTATLQVAGTAVASTPLSNGAGDTTTSESKVEDGQPDSEKSKGKKTSLLAYILAAIGGGLFALVMPCTYPMIPITISFFTKQATDRGGSVLPLSLAYGFGIIAVFVLIGVTIGQPIIAFAVHEITNLLIGGIFIVFALSLFGMYTLQPPQFLMSAAGKASMKGGYTGVFLMGTALVVTSFTCTGPFVATILAIGGQGEGANVGRVALGMAVFGATMAIPFVVLSLLPGKLQSMPKSGDWMNTVKVFLGFVEVAAALKFISNADLRLQWEALSRELFLVLWAVIFGAAAMYLFGWIRVKGESGEIGPGRMTAGLAVALFAGYCVFGAMGNRMDQVMSAIIPPYSVSTGIGASSHQESGHTIIENDYQTALRTAREEGKTLLVNFTGYT